MTGEEGRLNMNGILKYVAAATMTGALALAATTAPTQAHDWHPGGAAAAIGFGAGAILGAAATNAAYNDAYYYGGDYAYAPGYAGYGYDSYAYAGPVYYGSGWDPRARSRSLNHGQGPGCLQSPGSMEYTSCD
jgi:hypothetical protein